MLEIRMHDLHYIVLSKSAFWLQSNSQQVCLYAERLLNRTKS